MISHLRLTGEKIISFLRDKIEFELSQGIKLQARVLSKNLMGFGQDVVRSKRGSLPVLIYVAADKIQASLIKRVEKSRAVLGHHIDIGKGCLHHSLEQRTAVYTFALCQDVIGPFLTGDRELQLFEAAVQGGIVKGDLLDLLFFNDVQQVFNNIS